MKEYKKPQAEVFELRSAEKIAATVSRKVKVNGALLSVFNLGQSATSDAAQE